MKQGDRVMDEWGYIYRVVWLGREALLVTPLNYWPEGEDFLQPGRPMPLLSQLDRARVRQYDEAIHQELERVTEEYLRASRKATSSLDEQRDRQRGELFARLKPLGEEE